MKLATLNISTVLQYSSYSIELLLRISQDQWYTQYVFGQWSALQTSKTDFKFKIHLITSKKLKLYFSQVPNTKPFWRLEVDWDPLKHIHA